MARTYDGSCQCGAVTFSAELDLTHAVICNCSRCRRLGSVFAFTPRTAFTLRSGEDALTEFRFHNEVIAHLFCATCGIEAFGYGRMPDGTETVAVNARVLDGVDGHALAKEATFYDGAAS
ncbi:GFA family protein [Wenxinia marina]|uniref:CENP-V/GFA domain-containing protein n=1 Tax=Wenxinia marina DSM 24838 TaxID=1123501 RepID=A0A0D0Q004_9RHOB|nr:GFA family protein [Wenxinia marina]KIQ67944.1 hypothetical protein Wenmar_03399 [Wenxinia marina DSM 24838]GGL76025.1 aldehyde-activating protein [Wenxinia marina]